MVELQDEGVCLTAVHAWVFEQVVQQPLLVDVNDFLLPPPGLGLVVVDVSPVVVLAVDSSTRATAGIA